MMDIDNSQDMVKGLEDRFVDNEDNTVTDTCTGLMWQKETPCCTFSWQESLHYCEDLKLAGHSDWRLPNIRELQSIVDYGRYRPATDPVFGTEPSWYWSSTSHENPATYALRVNFDGGDAPYGLKTEEYHVRAVRSVTP